MLTGDAGLEREIRSADAASPGLALTGYTARVAAGRILVLGETEVTYLHSLDAGGLTRALDALFACDCPVLFVTKGQDVPDDLVASARNHDVALVRTALKTAEFYNRIKPFLEDAFAAETTLHGSLVDVYGVGLLFMGRSGIGKSECVLDLVERGHRLVADDVVMIRRLGHDVLIGRGHQHAQHFMEIRGVGLIDIAALFGIRAVRQQKRIEVIVQLEDWDSKVAYERTGLGEQHTLVLDVDVPKVVVPLNPGKNITVISEVVAMRHLLRYSGVDSAKQFNDRLIARMQGQRAIREYLEEDYE